MTNPVLALLVAVVLAVAVSLLTGVALRWCPSPQEEPELTFAAIDSPRLRVAVFVVGFIASGLILWLTPISTWPIWVPLAPLGALLAVIDYRTSYLPMRLHYLTFALVGLGAVASAWWRSDWWTLLWAVGVAVLASCFYGAVWWLSGGQLGFGDVRLAGLLGVATAATSPRLAMWSYLIGAAIGAVWAIVLRLRGKKEFAYGPSMLLGVPITLIWMTVVG